MRDPARIDRICDDLKILWHKHPDERLGQLLENYIFGCEKQHKRCIFHIEDDQTELQLKRVIGDDKQNGKEDDRSILYADRRKSTTIGKD